MRKLLRFILTFAILLGVALGAARAVAIRFWRIPSDDPYLDASITPTLSGGDWVVLWRFSPPHQGDLVFCPEPKAPERVVIGRMAALEGDDIEVDGANVRLNQRRVGTEETCASDRFTVVDPQSRTEVDQPCQLERLAGKLHPRGEIIASSPPPERVATSIGAGQVFLLSDNRQFPYDSRDFGPVERSTCKEKVVFRLVSAAGFRDVQHRLTFIH